MTVALQPKLDAANSGEERRDNVLAARGDDLPTQRA
jgi:hypothetical protein